MRSGVLWLLALGSVAALATAIVLTALGSANGAPRGAVLVAGARKSPPPDLRLELGRCSPAGGEGGSALVVEGPCSGVITGKFACTSDGELEALSIGRPAGAGKELYLTILLFDFAGPGDYFEDEITAQVIGPDTVPRWTSTGTDVTIHASASGAYTIGNGVLLPELGTPATGVITLHGTIVCE